VYLPEKNIKVNFLLESFGNLKYLGSSTAAGSLIEGMKNRGVHVCKNSFDFDFDIVHAHTFGPFPLFYTKIAKKKQIPAVISAHSIPSLNEGNVFGGVNFWNRVYRKTYNFFDHVIAVSNFCKDELEKIGVKKPIDVVNLGIEKNKYKFSEKRRDKFREYFKFKNDDFVVLNVAQLIPRKGVFDWIETAKSLPDVKFVWVGGFPFSIFSSNFLKIKSIIKNKYKNVIFTGFLKKYDEIDILDAYSGADAFLTPTLLESFGRTIIEAGSVGLPVIARDIEVFHELFGQNIFYAKTSQGFANKILFLKENGENFYGKKLENFVGKKYTIENEVCKMISVYKKII
jgi:glycosyltransferase involved in cell wall biosynthesis